MRRYLIFGSTALGLLLFSIDSTAVAVAVPSMMRELNAEVRWASWAISMFFIGVTMATPLGGSLSDSFGRKRVFLGSLMFFTAGSVACAFAPNIYVLVLFRFIEGFGGASILPSAVGIVSDTFPQSRQRVVGLFASIYPVGGLIGPNLGGWIVSRYSWRSVFLINLPISLIMIVMIMVLLSDSRKIVRHHIDVAGASLMTGTIFCLMFGLNFVGEGSMTSFLYVAFFLALSVCLALLFFRHEKKEEVPVLDFTLLRSTPFLAANLINLVLGAMTFGLASMIPLYVTSVHGISTLMSGVILTPRSIGTICGAAIMSFFLKRCGYRWPIGCGIFFMACGTVLLVENRLWSMVGISLGSLGPLSVILLFLGLATGVPFPASNNAGMELRPDKIATIAGLRTTFRSIGGVLGVSIVTLILHAYRDPVAGFRTSFIAFAVVCLCAIPVVFFIPDGRVRPG
jgi:EmrB/QacA subfamily drug resistance transporter